MSLKSDEIVFPFERLQVYQKSRILYKKLKDTTSKYPEKEKYELTSQTTRDVNSVSSNIAEGASRNTSKDKAHYISISYNSLMEIVNHCILAFNQSYISDEKLYEIKVDCMEISKMSSSLKHFYEKDS